MLEQFDVIVLGAGQAGPALAVRCGKEGLKTLLVERHHFGGTCVNSHILMVTGRVPNTHDLGLTAAGIVTDARGYIRVNEGLATSVEGVSPLMIAMGVEPRTH